MREEKTANFEPTLINQSKIRRKQEYLIRISFLPFNQLCNRTNEELDFGPTFEIRIFQTKRKRKVSTKGASIEQIGRSTIA